jgi:hypothetical protein
LLTLESNPLSIRLIPWPHFGGCRTGKSDQLQASASGDPFIPVSPSPELEEKRKKDKVFKKIKKDGLTDLRQSSSFKVFIKAWPLHLTHRLMEPNAWNTWKQLERSHGLADNALILQALKDHPPTGKMWPQSWLKKRHWRKTKAPISCRICFDEGLVYGPRLDGSKGALPCPKCKK